MKVTRKDVAEKAGVSTATVSNVINKSKYVSKKLTKKVELAIQELDYKPNLVAKSLTTKKTKQVAIFIGDITNPYYSKIILGFERKAKELCYVVNICIGNSSNIEDYFDDFYTRNFDGIYLLVPYNKIDQSKIDKILNNGTVIVSNFSHKNFIGQSGVVDVNYYSVVAKSFKHLTDLGHEKIGFIDFSTPKIKENSARYQAYRYFIKKYQFDYRREYIVFGEPPYKSTIEEGYKYMEKLINRDTDISAVILINDYMAVGAMQAIKNNGLKVPEDISVMGIDNSIFSEIVNPRLTTVHVEQETQGEKAMDLIDKIQNKSTNNLKVEIENKLIIRESTAKIKEK
ncbi:MAG: LacI family DNA-binding transcriptional regulator [bacterium]